MTEKRFYIKCDGYNAWSVWEKDKDVVVFDLLKYDAEVVCKALNGLNDKNEQLKLICKDHRDHAIDFKADCMRLEKENEQLKKENHGIQDKVIRLLDYVEVKQCVTRTEIKKWWNGDV